MHGKQEKKRDVRHTLVIVFAALFLLSAVLLGRDLIRSARERQANEELASVAAGETLRREDASASSNAGSGTGTGASDGEDPWGRNYLPLVEQNGDMAAWLLIPDTQIDYPVMYTPEAPEHYLRKAFDESYALSGSLFIGADCAPSGSNIIIYGHNMKDGSMFGGLDAYADESFAKEHSEMIYDLISQDGSYERLTFEVMAVFYSRVYRVNEADVFRYYYGTDLSDPEDFQSYVEAAMSASLYDLGVTAEYGDRLLTLSTCSYHTDNGRFVIVAREK